MHAKRLLCCVLFVLSFAFPTAAGGSSPEESEDLYYADEILVTAARIQWPIDKTASFIKVISREDIAKFKTESVTEVLRSVVGLNVIQTGSLGKTSSIFMRGSNSNHCLLMINGVPLNDPTTGGFDLADLTISEVERIEIVRGPHGILYGSNAIGGVINIVTDTITEGARRSISVSGGSFGTAAGAVSLSGANGAARYSFSLSRLVTDGLFPNDFYRNTSLIGTASSDIKKNSKLSLTMKYNDIAKGVRGPSFDIDPNAVQTGGSFLVSAKYKQFVNSHWNFYLRTSFYTNEITFDDPLDEFDEGPFAGDMFSEINSDIQDMVWQNNMRFMEHLWVVSGLDMKRESTTNGSSGPFGPTNFQNTISNVGLFLSCIFDLPSVSTASSGIRIDTHSEFGTVATYKFSVAVPLDRTGSTIKGSVGSGFRAPGLNELYYPNFGNPDLLPEETVGYDIGVRQEIEPLRLSIETAYFRNDYENMISFDPETFLAGNIGESRSDGLEVSGALDPTGSISLRGFYTYLDTEDRSTGKELLRRPRHSGGVSLSVRTGPFDVLISSALVGRRLDNDFGGPLGEHFNSSYSRHDIAVTYHHNDRFEVFVRTANVLDERYEEVAGYRSPGIHATAGAKYTF